MGFASKVKNEIHKLLKGNMRRMSSGSEEGRLATRLNRLRNREPVPGAKALASVLDPNKKQKSTGDSRREFYEKLVRATRSKYQKSAEEYQRRKKPRTEYERIVEKMF
jgi:hypothetical protein